MSYKKGINKNQAYNSSTGLQEGGILNQGTGPTSATTISISAGKGIVSFPTGGVVEVSWPAIVNETVTTIGIAALSTVGIDVDGNINFKPGVYNESDLRDFIQVGRVGHGDLATINIISREPVVITNGINSFYDFANTFGPFNQSGNVLEPASTDLTIKRSAGSTMKLGINFDVDPKKPNSFLSEIDTNVTWSYVRQDGSGGTITDASTSVVNVGQYDDLSGTLASVPSNRFTITRAFFFAKSNTYLFVYPQELFNNIDDAIAAVGREELILGSILDSLAARSFIITKGNATDLTNSAQAKLIEGAAFFGGGINTSSGGGSTDLPTTTKGDLVIHNGSGNVRFPIGTNNQHLIADSSDTNGARWADAAFIGDPINGSINSVSGTNTASGSFAFAVGNGNIASGAYSHAEGFFNVASGAFGSHVEGNGSKATGQTSHSEGSLTQANGASSHAEGSSTKANGPQSHAEGLNTTADGNGSHAEGLSTLASGNYSHAEGYNTLASGIASHSQGTGTTASGNQSHAEGRDTTASGSMSHAEGKGTLASGSSTHAEGFGTVAGGDESHAEGGGTIASGVYSHAEGYKTTASGDYGSHTEGYETIASGDYGSHAEGKGTLASGAGSHAEGSGTVAGGDSSHAEGYKTTASGKYSHTEGLYTLASGIISHAEGFSTIAGGDYSHAEGRSTSATSVNSHAGGYKSTASGSTSFIHSDNSTVEANNAVILGGFGNRLTSIATGSTILGGTGITGTSFDTVYVPNIEVSGNILSGGTNLNNIFEPIGGGGVTVIFKVSFEKTGVLNLAMALDVFTSNVIGTSGFTKLEYVGLLGSVESGSATAAGDLEISVYTRPGKQGSVRTLGGGTLVSTDIALTSISSEGVLFDRSFEVVKTDSPIDITAEAGEFLWVDISSVGNWTLNDMRVDIFIRLTV